MKTSNSHSRYAQLGLTLVELMIAMVLGLVVVAGALTIFTSSMKSSELNSALTDIQDSARFALDTMTRDVRMSGFQGCVDINTSTAQILAISAPTSDFFSTALTASVVEESGLWSPSPPVGFIPPTDKAVPVPGTHALAIQFGNSQTYTFNKLETTSSNIVMESEDSGLVAGDLALISNCQIADIFEITSVSGATLQHNASANYDKRLTAPYGQGDINNRSRIMRFESNIYYIGDSGKSNPHGNKIYSLYKQTLPYSDENPPIEMIEGVANMKIQLGVRDAADVGDDTLTYIYPDLALTVGGRVEVVKIGILMQSYDPILEEASGSTYYLAGLPIEAGSEPADENTSYVSDKRLTLSFNTTVKIRNRR